MLWTNSLALSALQAITRFSLALGNNCILAFCAEFRAAFLTVLYCKDVRNRDSHRTSFSTIAAPCARNGFVCVIRCLSLLNYFFLMLCQRFEISEGTEVVFHLGNITHSTETARRLSLLATKRRAHEDMKLLFPLRRISP